MVIGLRFGRAPTQTQLEEHAFCDQVWLGRRVEIAMDTLGSTDITYKGRVTDINHVWVTLSEATMTQSGPAGPIQIDLPGPMGVERSMTLGGFQDITELAK